jgi:predicted MFS family arabinose efflux permease
MPEVATAAPAKARSLPRPLIALFAVACGIAVANVYYAQPVLDAMAASFAISSATLGIVVAVTQVGYGLGLVLLVPLGDMLDRRKLIVGQLALSSAALVVVATAPSAVVLLAGMAVVGMLAVVTQVLVAFAATLAAPHQRGAVVGSVTSGVVIGILLARTIAGTVTELAGWRAVYLASSAMTLTVALLLLRALPRLPGASPRLGYGRLLGSMLRLYAEHRTLRVRACLAMLIFAVFNVLWTPLALPLREPPLSLSHGAIGLFGLAGAAGALAAARAGRLADRGLGRGTTGVALTLLVLAWLPLGFVRHSLLALVLGLVLLDLAVQAVHVTSQSVIYGIDPAARSRLVGAYMVFYSIGSAAGAAGSTVAYDRAGWAAVCVLGAAIGVVGLTVWAVFDRVPPIRDPAGSEV